MICHYQEQINKLDLAKYNYNIDDFDNEIDRILTTLENSGGSEDN